MDFILQYSIPSHKWHLRGIEQASPQKTDPISAYKMLSYASVEVDKAQEAWQVDHPEFALDPRISDHIAVEC